MGIKFFGQFLIEIGEVDPESLRSALDLMERENLTLGELAVRAGFADESDCRRVNGEQRRRDRPFGELARAMGILNSIELEELLQSQLETRINVGEALLQLGHLTPDRLAELEDLFKRDQEQTPRGEVVLPDALSRNRLAACLVDMLPRHTMRMARLEARVCDAGSLRASDPEVNLVASLVMVGSPGVQVHLLSELCFARKLAAGIAGFPESSVTVDLSLDGLGEFLNVLAGNAMSRLEAEGVEYRLEAPRYGQSPQAGWWFEIASNWGRAALVLNEV
ncbi:MAG: hypothetical protein JRG94_13925 [Deltaproteobacteria bacterium]|nr:hypothetical protein [Deltaproteobacteria bacterium]